MKVPGVVTCVFLATDVSWMGEPMPRTEAKKSGGPPLERVTLIVLRSRCCMPVVTDFTVALGMFWT